MTSFPEKLRLFCSWLPIGQGLLLA
jgi:hypothetical protein